MSKLLFSDDAWEDYLYWQSQDKKTLKRINSLVKDIERNGNEGIGAPALPTLLFDYFNPPKSTVVLSPPTKAPSESFMVIVLVQLLSTVELS